MAGIRMKVQYPNDPRYRESTTRDYGGDVFTDNVTIDSVPDSLAPGKYRVRVSFRQDIPGDIPVASRAAPQLRSWDTGERILKTAHLELAPEAARVVADLLMAAATQPQFRSTSAELPDDGRSPGVPPDEPPRQMNQ